MNGQVNNLVKAGGKCQVQTFNSQNQYSRCRLLKISLRLGNHLRLQVYVIFLTNQTDKCTRPTWRAMTVSSNQCWSF